MDLVRVMRLRSYPPEIGRFGRRLAAVIACAALGLSWGALHSLDAAEPVRTELPPGHVPGKVYQTTRPHFPPRVKNEGVVRGEAQVVAEVDANGRLTDTLVVAYTRREFATEAIRAMKRWKFEPSLLDHTPVTSILHITFDFEVDGVVVRENFGTSAVDAASMNRLTYWPVDLKNLDRVPELLEVTQPIYPREWIEQGREGTVTIEFYIDEKGWPRMPVIVAHDDLLLASSSLAAVKEWRFEPPVRHGKPVLAITEQVFHFRRPSESARRE